ncbi:FHA domain-containing protein [Roseateles amylovorans]|jgi:Inner membrane component of T3SS, cytoplasmic domain|uniref:FHA domain-containing protein n=1 Tax=Roseateles amylovorans TaxID=2978473 RepID=A0ABY6AXD0_9BURK|nr:FHA domain-containing protein [Roseateles amylovorans]UXH77327.1 FHA domain-containing protein [Roseateles amylovorans]
MDHAAVIEILDRDGHCRELHKVRAWPVRIGRSPEADLVLSDPHLAGLHALLHWAEDGPRLNLLDSQNGGWFDGERVAAGESRVWSSLSTVQLGTTRLRLRTALDPLMPERLLPRADEPVRRDARPAWALPALLAVWLLMLWVVNWSGSDASASWVDAVSGVLAPLGVALIWAGLWALVTQLFRHWFAFGAHLWRAMVASVLLQAVDLALPLLAYAFSWPRLMALEGLTLTVVGAVLLWWHASVVWPRAQRRLAVGIGAMAIVGLVLTVGRRTEQQYWLGPNYLSALPPPSLRLAEPKPVDGFIESMQSLEAPLKRQALKRNELESGSGDEE